ncbi:META domain-containing protein [Anderseniella sp. Alg231-50]|uniref:META domain-containing protein n=1 Tax=Anderseniella sp. Alg231-50 TaxID=1922226 RepID=UPI00307B9122
MLIFASATGEAGGGSLAGSEWGLGEGDDRFVQFGADGKVSGHAGCNRFFTSYERDGTKLKIAGIATTRKLCSDATMKREKEWLGVLKRVRAIELTHLKLILYGAKRTRLATLKRRDFD